MNQSWIKFLPTFVRLRIEGRDSLQQVITNTGWLFFDRILRMGVGLIVGVWVARYLGPEKFGIFNYALAFTALFGAIATLGLDKIVVRDIVQEQEQKDVLLGTAFVLKLLSGIVVFVIVVGTIIFLRPADTLTRLIVAIIAAATVLRAVDVIKFWFESQVRSKYTVYAENSTVLLVAAIKITLILTEAPLIAFAWAAFMEIAAASLGLLIVYKATGGILRKWQVQPKRAKQMLKDSWPLILSGLAIMVYMRIDQVMLGEMIGNNAVGIYSVAVRISEVWYFIPMAISSSVFPTIINSKNISEELYYQRLQRYYDLMAILGISVAVIITFSSPLIIKFLFGSVYINAADVLSIHIWSGVFVCLGVASSSWFMTENLQRYTFYRTFIGTITNVGLNLLFIPRYGVIGAALTTAISQAIASVLANSVNKVTRKIFVMQIKSLLIFRILQWHKKQSLTRKNTL